MKKGFKHYKYNIGLVIALAIMLGFIWSPMLLSDKTKTNTKNTPMIQPIKSLTSIIQKLQPKIDPVIAETIAKAVKKYSKKYNFPPELIIAIIKKESTFKPLSVSSANCVGLMQINCKMHTEKLKKLNIKGDQIFYIDNNINMGCLILKEYYTQTKSVSGALKKYLGVNNTSYLLAILSSYADLNIDQKIISNK